MAGKIENQDRDDFKRAVWAGITRENQPVGCTGNWTRFRNTRTTWYAVSRSRWRGTGSLCMWMPTMWVTIREIWHWLPMTSRNWIC